jgi:hypothetical protein
MHVFGGERLHQAAEREIGHREARRLAADEQARHAKVVQAHRHREAGGAAGEVQVEQDEVRLIFLGCRDRAVGILGHGDDPVARIVLDQIFERDRQLAVVFDDEDIEHSALPARNSPRKFRHLDGCAEWKACESLVNGVIARVTGRRAETKGGATSAAARDASPLQN